MIIVVIVHRMKRISNLMMTYWREIVLAILVIVSRAPFVTKYLFNWDAVQFALALEHFDISQHQPHPPGYIIYVGLGSVVNSLFHNANTSFIIISILGSCLATLLCYYVALEITRRRSFSFLLSALFLSNPFVWFFGEITSTYIFDAVFALLFALLTLRIIRKKEWSSFYWFTFFIALAGGVRESLIILFLPLYLFSYAILLKHHGFQIARFVTMVFIGSVTVATWLIPLLALSGGWHTYWSTTTNQLSQAAQGTSIFKGVPFAVVSGQVKNVLKISLAILYILLFIPTIGVVVAFFSKQRLKYFFQEHRLVVLLFVLWFAPSFFVYSFIHLGQAGYLMTIAPALILLSGFFLLIIPWRGFGILCVVLQCGVFLVPLAYPDLSSQMGKNNYWLGYFNVRKLQNHDKELSGIIDAIRAYIPKDTILVTEKGFRYRSGESWVRNTTEYFREVEYYLPEYHLYEIFWKSEKYFHVQNKSSLNLVSSKTIFVPPSTERIIIITDNIDRGEFLNNTIIRQVLGGGNTLFILPFGENRAVSYGTMTFERHD